MNKIEKLLDNPAKLESWLTAKFGELSVKKDPSGLFITTAAKNPKVVDEGKLGTLVPVEGDGNNRDSSVRDFFKMITRGRPLVLSEDKTVFSLNQRTLTLKPIIH